MNEKNRIALVLVALVITIGSIALLVNNKKVNHSESVPFEQKTTSKVKKFIYGYFNTVNKTEETKSKFREGLLYGGIAGLLMPKEIGFVATIIAGILAKKPTDKELQKYHYEKVSDNEISLLYGTCVSLALITLVKIRLRNTPSLFPWRWQVWRKIKNVPSNIRQMMKSRRERKETKKMIKEVRKTRQKSRWF